MHAIAHGGDNMSAEDAEKLADMLEGKVTNLAGADSERHVRDCVKPWVKVEGLQMPTAMHAHAAITVPWLPLLQD